MPAIQGNCDRQVVTFEPKRMGLSDAYARQQLRPEHLAWLARLPPVLRPVDDVFVCHGTPSSDETYFLEDLTPSGPVLAPLATIDARAGSCDAALILCGHTHVPRVVRLDGGRIVVNPGSVGLQAYQDDEPFHHIMQTGSPEARYAILERAGDRWTAELIRVEYDWREAAGLAAERGRPDWATALATGRLSG
jgi:predicted phosphodiesterase